MPIEHIKKVAERIAKPKIEEAKVALAQELYEFRKGVKENFASWSIYALALVTALTWNEAIKQAIIELGPSSSLAIKIYSAISLTVFAIIAMYWLAKWKAKPVQQPTV